MSWRGETDASCQGDRQTTFGARGQNQNFSDKGMEGSGGGGEVVRQRLCAVTVAAQQPEQVG